MCPVVCRCGIPWGMACLSVIMGTGEVGVLLSVRILLKSLVHCFINGVIVVNAKLVHVLILFSSQEYVVFFETIQKFFFFSFSQLSMPSSFIALNNF
jgi:hypothetical protein